MKNSVSLFTRDGVALSPSQGYTQGNISQNPGGNALVILIGAAAPLKTPVIGPPVPFR